ncbi:MAG: glycosyltransferase [Candidatus Eisenbacteria bacterium]
MTRVCCFGAYDPLYPRNRILRQGLRRAGLDVVEACVASRRVWMRYPALLAAWSRVASSCDVMLVPEFRHKDMPLAHALHGRRPIVFDPLVSRHDTLVGDWKLHAKSSGQARWNRFLDRWSIADADLILCDTWAHGELFESLGAPRAKLRRVLVGAEDAFFAVPPPPSQGPVRILYVGGFLPLHGMPTVMEALAILERHASSLPAYVAQLVGTGIDHDAARTLAADHSLENVEFTGKLAYEDAPRVFAGAHITLGAFGAGEKAGRVIPHKLYQGLAAARAVVSGDGAGVREVLVDGEHLLLVPRGDPAALAQALMRLLGDSSARMAMGARARARALEVATPDAVGRTLASAISEIRP